MTTTKITKKDYFKTLIAMLNGEDTAIDNAELIDFCEHEIATLEKRAATSRAKAAEKREAGDELQDRIYGVLTEDWMAISDVVAALEDPEVTSSKVIYRLNALCASGRVEKTDAKISSDGGKARTIKVYRLVETE